MDTWSEVIRKEDVLYDKHVPLRILKIFKEDIRKCELYDILHHYPIIWKITMLLRKIALRLNTIKIKQCDNAD